MLIKFTILISLLSFKQISYAQISKNSIKPVQSCSNPISIKLTVQNVEKLFKESISYIDTVKSITHDVTWRSCNEDSIYYKDDTITVYRISNDSTLGCYDFISWSFYTKNTFMLVSEGKSSPEFFIKDYVVKVTKESNGLNLNLFNQKGLESKFKIIGIQIFPECNPTKISSALKLVRKVKN